MRLMLLPLTAFLGIYYLFLSGLISPFIQNELAIEGLLYATPIIILSPLTIVHLGNKKKLKIYAGEIGLGKKLDLYYEVTSNTMKTAMYNSLFSACGLLLTGHEGFSIYFAVIIFWVVLQWPSPRKVCKQLMLKGDERTMVLTKGEAFKF